MIVDMGLYFDGKCARCRESINPGDHYRVLDEPPSPDVRHGVVHAPAQGDEFVCETKEQRSS